MKTTIEPLEDGNTRIRIPIEFRYDNGRKRIFFPEMPDEHLKINEPLATGIARAYRWQELLDKGEYDSPESLSEALGVHTSYVRRFLRLALLAPPIVDAIFAGKAPWTAFLDQTRHHLALFLERANGTFRYVVKINSGKDVQTHIFAGVFLCLIHKIFICK